MGSQLPAATSALRRLLKAARLHDATPALKSLLPLTAVGVEVPLSSPSAPPLLFLVKSVIRQGALPSAALRGVTELLEANLRRGRRYERKIRDEELRSLRSGGVQSSSHSNLAWYHSRLTAALQRATSSELVRKARAQAADSERARWLEGAWAAAAAAAGVPKKGAGPVAGTSARGALALAAHPDEHVAAALPDDPVDLFREMLALGVVPPRRMVVHALCSLALSGEHGDFERALGVLYILDLHTPHVACTTCVDALVSGALLTQPPSGGMDRALDVAVALHTSCQLVPSTGVVNRMLEVAASRVSDGRSLQRCKDAMRRFAAARVPILGDVSVALLAAAMRLNDRHTAVWSCRQVRARGGSVPAQLLLDLLEWSVADGDTGAAEFLTEELLRTDKALYLAAINNPSC